MFCGTGLLNLKSIAVKVHSPGLKKMYIKANGSGEIRAGNFETDSETEIMNKDQLIMTLDANADVESIKKDLIKDDRLEKFLNQREIKKIIVVPGKIINIVC